MAEGLNDESMGKSDWFSGCLVFVLFIGGFIMFGFGVVGLYEDREFLSVDSILAGAGLAMVVFCLPFLFRSIRKSEESSGYSVGGGCLFLIVGSLKLAAKMANDKPWWDKGFAVLMISLGICWIFMALREKSEAAEVEEPSAGNQRNTADMENPKPAE